jgi:hypothetical protein
MLQRLDEIGENIKQPEKKMEEDKSNASNFPLDADVSFGPELSYGYRKPSLPRTRAGGRAGAAGRSPSWAAGLPTASRGEGPQMIKPKS